ncbi:NAD-dependent epimerase/dehydratase family protein [Bradymonas sediminis]|uniref:Epimerase n=1 Tax=Bradymonas sediminis TaxID=1548548 RepID=A0A2Z4FKX4_9DELT|nr:NAD-dependent epimerase/dehydratase family protein [Bradymonas sediminis]AWV89647.1 epimerase [Bradymonas sediminis]TDP76613.1 UDP-glucose 4-epimerase [Bradymonas sediminis]
MKVLITGISSKLGRLVAGRLVAAGHQVLGVDRRGWPSAPEGVKMFHADIRKRPAEDVFRTERPDAAIHMATVTHVSAGPEERYRINLRGTRTVFDHCHTYGVKHAVFVGRHTFYGAASDAPNHHSEADPPLAVSTFPALADLVAADLFAGSALWRFPEMDTAVLRLCYTLGESGRGTLANYIRGPRVPTILGFDPLYQFIHEEDAARAICETLEHKLRGVYNVAGPQPVPLSLLIQATGRKSVMIPEPLFNLSVGRFGLPDLPRGATAHIKYPIVVDDHAFRKATGFETRFDEIETMHAYAQAHPLSE